LACLTPQRGQRTHTIAARKYALRGAVISATMAGLLELVAPFALVAQSPCPRGALPSYAHNDYENERPLTNALTLGFRGAEADVFLVGGVLRVGHDRRAARKGRSLEELYLAPLQALVARCGKLTADDGTFFLALEVKETSAATHDSLVALLGRYHELLAAPKPAVHVVLVGWHPPTPFLDSSVHAQVSWQHRITKDNRDQHPQLDARVRLLSLDYGKTMGRWWVRADERRRWLARLREVKAGAPDRLLRVHNAPVDARVYAELLEAGVDLIGTKQLAKTARLLAVPPAAGDLESARQFVQSSYDWYAPLSERLPGSSTDSVVIGRADHFGPVLREALQADRAAQRDARDIVSVLGDYDPFLMSQDPCPRYLARAATARLAGVEVRVYGQCQSGPAKLAVLVDVVRDGVTWRFADFRRPDAPSVRLLDALRASRAKRDTSRP
jgi:hypothetical protein